MNFRSPVASDFPRLAVFWQENYELKPHKGDNQETFNLLFERNQGLSTIAEEGDELVGSCIGTFDGRKAYIQKVAVRSDKRRSGLGEELVKQTCKKLKDAGAFQIQVNCEEDLVEFYKKAGFEVNPIVAMKMAHVD